MPSGRRCRSAVSARTVSVGGDGYPTGRDDCSGQLLAGTVIQRDTRPAVSARTMQQQLRPRLLAGIVWTWGRRCCIPGLRPNGKCWRGRLTNGIAVGVPANSCPRLAGSGGLLPRSRRGDAGHRGRGRDAQQRALSLTPSCCCRGRIGDAQQRACGLRPPPPALSFRRRPSPSVAGPFLPPPALSFRRRPFPSVAGPFCLSGPLTAGAWRGGGTGGGFVREEGGTRGEGGTRDSGG